MTVYECEQCGETWDSSASDYPGDSAVADELQTHAVLHENEVEEQ